MVIQNSNRTWMMTVTEALSDDSSLTAKGVLDNLVYKIQGTRPVHDRSKTTHTRNHPVVGTAFEEVDRIDNLKVSGQTGSRCYLKDHSDSSAPVTGLTVFSRGGGKFLIFKLLGSPAEFEDQRKLYETIVATMELRDPAEMQAETLSLILAGDAFLSSVNNSDIESVLDDEPVFYRLYDPARSGSPEDATEVAYQRVVMKEGQYGELSPEKPRSRWTPSEREYGYVVRVDARTLINDQVIDSQAIFFLSKDRTHESWSVTNVVRQGEALAHWELTGIRRDERLTVKTVEAAGQPTVADYVLPKKGYISRVELYLLPRLLALKGAGEGSASAFDLGFYNYDPALGKITLRRDSFTSTEAGGWICESRPTENADSQKTWYDDQGDITKRIMVGGRVMEPVAQSRLRKIWENKKLPIKE